MIPTQPGLPIPTFPPNPFQKGWQCPNCGQFVGDMQYHACSGINPKPLGTGTIESVDFGSGGVMSDFLIYSDFKKLFKRDTLAKFRERFLDAMVDLEQGTPPDSGDPVFGLDAIMDVFDDVAIGFRDDNSV